MGVGLGVMGLMGQGMSIQGNPYKNNAPLNSHMKKQLPPLGRNPNNGPKSSAQTPV